METLDRNGLIRSSLVVVSTFNPSAEKQKQPSEVFYIVKVFLTILQHSPENTCTRVSYQTQETAALVTFTDEILSGKLHSFVQYY